MENRITRLEVIVETMQSDISDIKVDLRMLRTELREDIKRLDDKTDRLDAKVDALGAKLEGMIHSTRLWAIWLYVGLAAGLFSSMAGGFMWMVSELKP